MAFIESPRFPTGISYGSKTIAQFNTSQVELSTGQVKRNRLWSAPVYKYDVVYGIRHNTDIVDLLNFFNAVGGPANSFRFKDWFDCTSVGGANTTFTYMDQVIGTGNGSTRTFQLVKSYIKGNLTTTRTIYKPISAKVSLNGAEQLSGWSLNTTTGIVTFSTAPTHGVLVRAGFTFDVPVAFVDDVLEISMLDKGVSGTSIILREQRF